MKLTKIGPAMLLVAATWACEVPAEVDVGTPTTAAWGQTNPPGTTPPPGPTCSGPATFDSAPLLSRGPVSAVSSVNAPAITAGASQTNAGEFRSNGSALEVISAGTSVPALRITSNAPDGVGIQARNNSPNAISMRIENDGTGPLLEAYRQGESTPRFEIRADARFYVDGQVVPERGPVGDPGRDGRNGLNGRPGAPGSNGRGVTFALCSEDSCLQTCKGGWIAIQAEAPCRVGADFGACEWAGSGGACCVCGT